MGHRLSSLGPLGPFTKWPLAPSKIPQVFTVALEESVIISCGGVRPRKVKGRAQGQLESDKASTESLFLPFQIEHMAKTQVPHTNLGI